MKPAWFLFALLVVPLAAGADANARDEDLATATGATTVTAVAVAAQTGDILAGTIDPGSKPGGVGDGPDLDTWYLFDSDGVQRFKGDVDHPGCLTRLQDTCSTAVVAAAIHHGGDAFLVAGNIPASIEETTTRRAIIWLGTDDNGRLDNPIYLDRPITHLTATPDLKSIVIATGPAAVGGTPVARVAFYEWDLKTEAGFKPVTDGSFDLSSPVRDLELSPDGKSVFVVADELHLRTLTQGAQSETFDAAAAAMRKLGNEFVVAAGSDQGTLRIFLVQGGTWNKFTRTPASEISAVAISLDGTVILAGDGAGKIHIYHRGATTSANAALVQSITVSDVAIDDITFTPDGKNVLVRHGDALAFYHSRGPSLLPLWEDEPGELGPVAMQRDAELIAAGVGAGVRVYDALHHISAAPEAVVVSPQNARDFAVTLTNSGNRHEHVQLFPDFPPGWFFTATPLSFNLTAGQQKDVDLKVVVPASQVPGTYAMHLNASLSGRAPVPISIPVEVPTVKRLAVVPVGATSLGAQPGEPILFTIGVENRGNVVESAELRVLSATPGWTAIMGSSRVEVAPGVIENVTVTVNVPSQAKKGDAGVVSVGLAGDTDGLLLTGTVGAQFEMRFLADSGAITQPGNETRIKFTVQNRGNAPDSYEIGVFLADIPPGYAVAFPGGQPKVTLRDVAAGGEAEVEAIIRVPADAPVDAILQLRFQATSLGDPLQKTVRTVLISIEESPGTAGPQNESPGLGLLALVGLLGIALWRRRSR